MREAFLGQAQLLERLENLSESLLEMEAINRVFAARISGEKLTSLKELMERAGITQDEIDRIPEPDLETPELG